jgi:hypothetical protein
VMRLREGETVSSLAPVVDSTDDPATAAALALAEGAEEGDPEAAVGPVDGDDLDEVEVELDPDLDPDLDVDPDPDAGGDSAGEDSED